MAGKRAQIKGIGGWFGLRVTVTTNGRMDFVRLDLLEFDRHKKVNNKRLVLQASPRSARAIANWILENVDE
jgi:hypothetical protein